MKIKCPLCSEEIENNPDDISMHFYLSEGQGMLHDNLEYLGKLLFKIHETLEKLETNPAIGFSAYFTKDGVEWAAELRDAQIRILKSLLDDEK